LQSADSWLTLTHYSDSTASNLAAIPSSRSSARPSTYFYTLRTRIPHSAIVCARCGASATQALNIIQRHNYRTCVSSSKSLLPIRPYIVARLSRGTISARTSYRQLICPVVLRRFDVIPTAARRRRDDAVVIALACESDAIDACACTNFDSPEHLCTL
jgi:hypothetical protein